MKILESIFDRGDQKWEWNEVFKIFDERKLEMLSDRKILRENDGRMKEM